jgi:hypothetical protein
MRLLHPCFRRPYLCCDTTAAAGGECRLIGKGSVPQLLQAGLSLIRAKQYRPAKTPARHRSAMQKLRQSPTAPKRQIKPVRGIDPRHEFRHFVLADSGWVEGQLPVPSMNGHYRNRCG